MAPLSVIASFAAIAAAVPVVALVVNGFHVVHQQSVGIVERFGKFSRVLQPGLHFVIPFVESIVARVDLRVQEVTADIEIKTRDNAFVELPVSLMTQVMPELAQQSHYTLAGVEEDGRRDANLQVSTWALNALRSAAAGLTLQELFEDRERLAKEVKASIDEKTQAYGYHIVDVLVDQPSVSAEVQASFNRVVASQREREAAEQETEARRVRIVGEAKAESEAQSLRAQGVANARSILAAGLTSAMAQAKERGVDEREVLALLVETNRLDTIRSAAEHGKLVVMDVRSPVPMTLPVTEAARDGC